MTRTTTHSAKGDAAAPGLADAVGGPAARHQPMRDSRTLIAAWSRLAAHYGVTLDAAASTNGARP